MVLNPHKCNFMILGGDKQTFDFICQENEIKYSQEQQPLRKTTDNKLNFPSHVKKLTKKAMKNCIHYIE